MILMLLSLAGLCLGIFGWLWLCAGFRRGGWRGTAGLVALQLSGLCLAYGVLRGQPMAGLFTAMFPPLAVVQAMALAEFREMAMLLAHKVAPWVVAVLLLALALRPLRVWAPGLAVLGALVGGAVVGDGVAEEAMCQAAAKRGISAFSRTGFSDSLTRAWGSPSTLHGLADAGEAQLGWSYRLMDWYALPEGQTVNRPDLVVACGR